MCTRNIFLCCIVLILASCNSHKRIVVLFENNRRPASAINITICMNNKLYQTVTVEKTMVADTYKHVVVKNLPDFDSINLKFIANTDTASCCIINDSITKNTVVHVNYRTTQFYSEVMYNGL